MHDSFEPVWKWNEPVWTATQILGVGTSVIWSVFQLRTYRLIADVAFDDNDSQTFFGDDRVRMISTSEWASPACADAEIAMH